MSELNEGDDFDDFLNARLDEEQVKELENLLEGEEQVEEKKLEEIKTPTSAGKVKIDRKLKTKEIKKINNVLENENQITVEFPDILNELKEEDLSLDEIQNKKISKLINSSIDTDEFLKKRFEKMIKETNSKFGRLLKIENMEEEIKKKYDTFTKDEQETFQFFNLSFQEKLITMEKFFEVLNSSLEKSIKKQISLKADKKRLKEMYFEKEGNLKDMKERHIKLDEKFISVETKLTHENNKLKRERDLLLQKLSKYETVDEKLIEQEATPLAETVGNSIQNWLSGWGSKEPDVKQQQEEKSENIKEEPKKEEAKKEKPKKEAESIFKFW